MSPETTRHLCDIRAGHHATFWCKQMIVAGYGHLYVYQIADIAPGDVLPREGDKPLAVS